MRKKKHGIPTSLQWKGLVAPVVQLYTMTFLGLGEKRRKSKLEEKQRFKNTDRRRDTQSYPFSQQHHLYKAESISLMVDFLL